MNIHDASLFRTSDWSGEGGRRSGTALLLLTLKSLATSEKPVANLGTDGDPRSHLWKKVQM